MPKQKTPETLEEYRQQFRDAWREVGREVAKALYLHEICTWLESWLLRRTRKYDSGMVKLLGVILLASGWACGVIAIRAFLAADDWLCAVAVAFAVVIFYRGIQLLFKRID